MKNILKCMMIIVGTLIGAGFASGQEIAVFFNRYLNEGLIGLFIAVCFFGFVIFFIMRTINKFNIKRYEDLIKGNKFVLFTIRVFTFICFCIMISAIGSYAEEVYSFSFWNGAIFAGIVCFISFLFKFTGLEKINNILVPFILLGTVLIGANQYNIQLIEFEEYILKESIFMNNWFLSAILYAGYNSILLMPILVELKNYNLKTKDILLLSILVVLVLGISGVLIYKAVSVYFPDILSKELPTLYMAKLCGSFIEYYYGIIILFAIFTTAFSSGYAFLKMGNEKYYFRNALIICILGVIFSRIGFSDLINFFFPLFGYLGILQILIILFINKSEGGQ